jgi:hypothetical protein
MMVVGMPLAMSHEVLETRLLVVNSKTSICDAWGGKEMATGREFEHLHERCNLLLN